MTVRTTAAARRVIRRVLLDAADRLAGLNLLSLGMAPAERLLAALAREPGGVARRLLADAGVDPAAVGRVPNLPHDKPAADAMPPHAGPIVGLMMDGLLADSEFSAVRTVTTADLLRALLDAPPAALRQADIDVDALRYACETADTADEGPGEPLDPPASIAALIDALDGPTADARTAALEQVLGRVAVTRRGAGRLVPAIAAVLTDPDTVNRVLAAQALGMIGPPARAAADSLRERFRDQPAVRVAAADALHTLGLAGTVPPAEVDAALDPAGGVRAAWTLWKYTADAERVVPRLRALLADPDPNTRAEAELYLREIDRPSEPEDFEPHDEVDFDETDEPELDRELADWTDALTLDPADVQALRGRAAAWERAGDRVGAIADWTAAHTLDPADVETLRALGWARVEAGDYPAAETDLSAAIRLAPTDTDLLYKRAIGRRRAGLFAEALADLDAVIAADPGKPNVHHARSKARAAAGNMPGAVADLEEAVRLDPDDEKCVNDLAWHLATAADPSVRDPGRAVALAERAVGLSGGAEPGVLDTLACAMAAAGRFDRAVAVAARAVALAAGNDSPFAAHLRLFRAGQAHVASPDRPFD